MPGPWQPWTRSAGSARPARARRLDGGGRGREERAERKRGACFALRASCFARRASGPRVVTSAAAQCSNAATWARVPKSQASTKSRARLQGAALFALSAAAAAAAAVCCLFLIAWALACFALGPAGLAVFKTHPNYSPAQTQTDPLAFSSCMCVYFKY